MRRSLALVLAAVPVLVASVGLAACSAAPTCTPTPPGTASNAVTVTGDLDGKVTVAIDGTLAPTTTERSVVIPGAGTPAQTGQTVNAFYSVFKGSDGSLIESGLDQSSDPTPFVLDDAVMISGVVKSLTCAVPGSRVVAVIPPADGFGEQGAQLGLAADESIILVADVVSIEDTPTAAPEAPQAPADLPTPADWTTDVPAVDLAASPPTVTIPDAPAPTDLVLTVLEEGDGAVVPNPANVTVDYVGTSWDTKEIFDSSYSRGQSASFSTSGVIAGFGAALVGQKVGSTILVSIPPALAYGTDPAAHDLGGQTLVFLVHIVSAE